MKIKQASYDVTLTRDEVRELRRALCERSMQLLCQAQKHQTESEELGREDDYSHIPISQRELVRGMIAVIDEIIC